MSISPTILGSLSRDPALLRPENPRRANPEFLEGRRSASGTDAGNTITSQPAQRVTPAQKSSSSPRSADQRSGEQASPSAPRREAPLGQRPRFVAKGQAVNIVV